MSESESFGPINSNVDSMTMDRYLGEANPRQFRILDVLALITIAAILSATLAPLLRRSTLEGQLRFVLVFAIQIGLTVAFVFYNMHARKKLLEKVGPKFGTAIWGGKEAGKYWPMIKALAPISAVLFFQVFIAAAVAFDKDGDLLSSISFYPLLAAFLLARCITAYMWRSYPGTVAFFEHGLVNATYEFSPWSCVSVRKSQFFDDQLAIVRNQSTRMLVVNERLRSFIQEKSAQAQDHAPREIKPLRRQSKSQP